MTSKKNRNPTRRSNDTTSLFRNRDDDRDVVRYQATFIEKLWREQFSHHEKAFGFLAFRDAATGRWIEESILADHDPREIASKLATYSRWKYDHYFCLNLFSRSKRRAAVALPTRFGWCDMDESDPDSYDPRASIVTETSPGRYQAVWCWDKLHTPKEAEAFSCALTYRHGGDKNGWSITKMLRVPGSVNHKPEYDGPIVKLIRRNWRPIAVRPKPFEHVRGEGIGPRMSVRPSRHDPDEVVEKYRRRLKHYTVRLIEHERVLGRDRSARIFDIVVALHHAGAKPDEIASVLWNNVYFISKHGKNLARLGAEISRILSKLEGGK